jgi:hypothetical protein
MEEVGAHRFRDDSESKATAKQPYTKKYCKNALLGTFRNKFRGVKVKHGDREGDDQLHRTQLSDT